MQADIVEIYIFTHMNFREFEKVGNFAWIQIRVAMIHALGPCIL